MARPDILLAALVALVAASPVMLVVAVIVRCALGSPVLFRQERAGKRGRSFTMVKFRTMTDARDPEGRLLPDSERTSTTGRFLRRTRLDELPELWNVARGEMAFIGPRPLLLETIVGAGSCGRLRGLVLPGLTGWAQVNGNASLSNDEKIGLDLWYIRNRSLSLDLRILVKTVAVVVRGERKALAVSKEREP